MDKTVEFLVAELAKLAKDVTDEELKDVATVSAGGNEKVRGAASMSYTVVRPEGSGPWVGQAAFAHHCRLAECAWEGACTAPLPPTASRRPPLSTARLASMLRIGQLSATRWCAWPEVAPFFCSQLADACFSSCFAPRLLQIGQLISDAMMRVGRAGVVTMEESKTAEDSLHVSTAWHSMAQHGTKQHVLQGGPTPRAAMAAAACFPRCRLYGRVLCAHLPNPDPPPLPCQTRLSSVVCPTAQCRWWRACSLTAATSPPTLSPTWSAW